MTTTPALDALRDVCARLGRAGIAYMLTGKDDEYRRTELERLRKIEFAGVPLWIVSIEDLILSTLEWMRESGSEQQRRDARMDILLDEVRRG